MKTKKSNNITKRLTIWALVVAGILMIPVLANFPWTGGDYVFAGVVLFACATAYEVITRNMKNNMYKLAVAAGVLLFILLVLAWAATGPANEATRVLNP